jgi:hypothetical protein
MAAGAGRGRPDRVRLARPSAARPRAGVRRALGASGMAAPATAIALLLSGCGQSGETTPTGATGATGPNGSTTAQGATGASGAAGGSGQCSDPNPSSSEGGPFIAVVCVVGVRTVPQGGSSRELALQIKITDKDPNSLPVSLADFELYDVTGDPNELLFSGANRLEPDYGLVGRTGVGDCYKVDAFDKLDTPREAQPRANADAPRGGLLQPPIRLPAEAARL